MERTIPTTESEEIELYQRTYYSLLRSSAEVKIRSLEEVHAGMNSLLHPSARNEMLDMSAFIYSLLRLPIEMPEIRLVILGQSEEVFKRAGFSDVTNWNISSAPARRRRCYFDGEDQLACFIASRSDIDDVIPLLTAFQIEWNKFHNNLRRLPSSILIPELCKNQAGYSTLAELLGVPSEDFDRLYAIWDRDFGSYMEEIASSPKDLRVQLLSGSLIAYRRATRSWWDNIVEEFPQITGSQVYFVSSNTHSLRNIVSGFTRRIEDELIQYLEKPGNTGLYNEWKDITEGIVHSSRENFLYYLIRKYRQENGGSYLSEQQENHEKKCGIHRISAGETFEIEAQVIELSKINTDFLDPRISNNSELPENFNDTLILNIDYPLGMAAYNILTEVATNVGAILGIYIMGKAATLNGVVGDVMISNVVHDEHSQNTFLFTNCFKAGDLVPDLVHGTVLDNQKAVTVQGTFLQNSRYMDVFYREGYTDIEMEAGPYLSAVYEMYRPNRHPINEIVNLYELPFDLGIMHYASDTPLGKGKNLGAGSLSYYGMDSTYAVTLAILRRILNRERERDVINFNQQNLLAK
ncbi:MAG: DUF6909 family protein [Anaerolineales bacterium]|jgi:hypothetical protein